MADISRIADVSISLETTGINKKTFDILLIAGPHVHALERVSTYTSASALTSDGYATDDPIYLAAVGCFSQSPRPKKIKIGRRQVDAVTLSIDSVSNSAAYALSILRLASDSSTTTYTYTYTSDESATAAEIAAGLVALINAATATNGLTATVSDNDLVLTNSTAGTAFALSLPSTMSIKTAAAAAEVAVDLTAILKEDSDWYGLGLTSRVSADILAAAAWAEANDRLFGNAVAEAGAITASSIADTPYLLKQKNYYRTYSFYHADAATEYPEMACMARCFAIKPGGETWAMKKLAGVTTDSLTETQYTAAKAKNCNTFESFRDSVSITQIGKVAAGEWIDVIRFRDWLQEEIAVNIFTLLANRDKVSFTDAGIASVEGQIVTALQLGQRRGGVAPTEYDDDGNEIPGYVVEVPLSADISSATKATRTLVDVSFSARLAGAIHLVEVSGSLVYNYDN